MPSHWDKFCLKFDITPASLVEPFQELERKALEAEVAEPPPVITNPDYVPTDTALETWGATHENVRRIVRAQVAAPEQGSTEWFALRNNMVTASDIASVLGRCGVLWFWTFEVPRFRR